MKARLFFLLAGLVLFLFSCGKSVSAPGKAVQNFTENLANGKIEEAKKYATEPTGKLLDMAGSFGGGSDMINPDYEFHFVRDSVAGNRAWVTFADEDGKEDTMEVVKIEGKWLVNPDMGK